ncbi:hypothetical protein JVU11DRAFT_4451 [Chiua virens]|nr:hypothetical protein JVU11DRAFT_4451 [Chiua virens]
MIIKTEPIDSVVPIVPVVSSHRKTRVEVLLPTKKHVYGTDAPEVENASTFIARNNLVKKEEPEELRPKLFFFGKVEIKKEEMLSEDVVSHRLANVPSYGVDLDPVIRDVTTTRIFTSRRWGGNTQATFPEIRAEMLARHGLDDFMYLNLFFNPHAPQWPGQPGLFFASSVYPEAEEWQPIKRVLVRLKSNCWFYVGQYHCIPAASLTPDEWKAQAPRVKQTWTNKVSTQGWGIDIRAKLVLQKRLGRNPTIQELRDAVESENKFSATPEEIHDAFDRGDAFIHSWVMKCVGYDENFQREIAAGNAAN